MNKRLICVLRTTGTEVTDRVAPMMLKQMLKVEGLQFIDPDAVGVGPRCIHSIGSKALNINAALVKFRGDAEGGWTTAKHQHISAVGQDQPSA